MPNLRLQDGSHCISQAPSSSQLHQKDLWDLCISHLQDTRISKINCILLSEKKKEVKLYFIVCYLLCIKGGLCVCFKKKQRKDKSKFKNVYLYRGKKKSGWRILRLKETSVTVSCYRVLTLENVVHECFIQFFLKLSKRKRSLRIKNKLKQINLTICHNREYLYEEKNY